MSDPTTIGRHKIINRLGRGGMGALFLAHDPAIDRMVAIKVMREGVDSAELRERFAREARAAGRLRHPNIVTIFDVGEDNGQPFIAMEYVPGETLEALIQRRARLPLARKLKIVEELCDGLSYAHKAGVVHRDIKPANLMLDSDGTLKILDFGIVRFAQSGMTQAGILMGTLAYMSPEQVAGKPIDYRSDIFAVGDVAYELLSGKQAFPGSLQDGIMNRILHSAPKPLEQLAPGLDAEVIRVVTRALEKDPGDRYQDLGRMRRDLAKVRERIEDEEETAAEDSSEAETVVAGQKRSPKPDSSGGTPRPPTDGAGPRAAGRREVEQRRQARIQQYLDAAQKALDAGDFQAAIAAADDASLIDPNNQRAIEIADRAHVAAEEKQVHDWLDEARQHLGRGDATQAAGLVEQARGLRPSSPDVRSMQQTIDDVRRELELARERAQIVREAVARARADFAAGSFEIAIRAANEALARQPHHTEALEIRQQASVALEEQRKREQHERAAAQAIEESRREFEAGQFDHAIQRLEQFEPPHADVSRALDDFRQRAVEIKRRREEEEREALRRKVAALTAAAQQAANAERFDEAIDLLERVRELDPALPATEALLRQVIERRAAAQAAALLRAEVEGKLREATAVLERDDLGGAASLGAEALRVDPQSPAAQSFQKSIESKADALLSSARHASADGRYDEAVEIATRVRELQSHAAAAAALIHETQQRRAAAEAAARKRAQIKETVAGATAALERHDFRSAARLYQEALAIDSSSDEVLEFGRTLQRRSEALLAAAREAVESGRLEEGLQLVGQVREIEPKSHAADLIQRTIADRQAAEREAARIRALIEENLKQASTALSRGELGVAVRLQEESSKLDAGHDAVKALATEITRRRSAVESHTAAARQAIQKRDFQAALDEIDRGRALDSESKTLAALGEQATAALAEIERVERRRKQVATALAGAAERLERGELDAALTLVNGALGIDQANADARALQQRVQQAIDARAEQQRLEAERRAREARVAKVVETVRNTRDHGQAIRLLRQALTVDVDRPELLQLAAERERAQEVERIRAEEQRRADEQARLAAEQRAREERLAAEQRAREERLAAEQRAREEQLASEQRAREARIAKVIEKARKTRPHDQAIQMLREALAIDATHRELLALIAEREQAQQAERTRLEEERRAAERRAREAAVAKALQKAGKSRSHDAALRILREALPTDPDNVQLLTAIREREAALAQPEVRPLVDPMVAGDAGRTARATPWQGTWLVPVALLVVAAVGVGIWSMRDRLAPSTSTGPSTTAPSATTAQAPDASASAPGTSAGVTPPPLEPPAAPATDSPAAVPDAAANSNVPPNVPADSTAPANPKNAAEAALERRLAPLRQQARQQLASGQAQQALVTAQNGLKLKADDDALRGLLRDLVAKATADASAARTEAEKSDAPTKAAATYRQGLRLQTDALAERGPDRAARGLWSARDTFTRAAGEARQVAAAEAEKEKLRQAQAQRASETASARAEPPASSPSTIPPPTEPPTNPPVSTRPSAPTTTAPVKPGDTPTPARPSPADENAAIEQVLRGYVAAYNSKSVDAIRRIYALSDADAKSLDKMFREARDYKMEMNVQNINVSGDKATVTGVRRVQFRSSFGNQDSGPRPTELTLQKRGSGWLIVSVR